jgi:hypothetical protein
VFRSPLLSLIVVLKHQIRHGWSYLFYIVAGATLVPIIAGVFVLPSDPRRSDVVAQDRRLDYVGGLLATAATSLFLFSIVQSGIDEEGWSTPCSA